MQKQNTGIQACRHDLNVNGNALRFTDNTLAIFYAENALDSTEIRNFRFGTIQYGLYQHDNIPFLLIEIAGFKFDFAIDGYDLIPGVQRSRLNSYSGRASFTIVLPRSSKVVAERVFSFDLHFTSHLKSCLQQQWKYYHSESEVRKKAKELMEFLKTNEMFEGSKLYKYPA